MLSDFYKKVEEIIEKDCRYKPDAYEFVMEALWFTQNKLKRKGHVRGKELLAGIRELAIDKYGPMVRTVFEHWGIRTTEDFGEIVFNMVENALLSKTEDDSREDFKNVYDFKEVFDSQELFRGDK